MNRKDFLMAISMVTLSVGSCTKSSDRKVTCSQSIPPIYLDFNIVGSSSGEDLFFSNSSTLNLKDIYFFKNKDILYKDTIRPEVEGAGTTRSFKLRLDNTKPQDTLILKIGKTSTDILIDKLKRTDDACPTNALDKIYLNNVELLKTQNKFIIKK